jgi:hypothetical protein
MDQPTATVFTGLIAASAALLGGFSVAAWTRRNSEAMWRIQQLTLLRIDLYRTLLASLDANRRFWEVTKDHAQKFKTGRLSAQEFAESTASRNNDLKKIREKLSRAKAAAALISEDTFADFERIEREFRAFRGEFTEEFAANLNQVFTEGYERIALRGREELREARLRV